MRSLQTDGGSDRQMDLQVFSGCMVDRVNDEHGEKVSAKHVQCCAEGCNKMLRIHPMGNVTNRRCKEHLKLQIQARNKTYGGAWRTKGTYGTSDEIFFFDTLPVQKKHRYFELMPLRKDWGDIDPKMIKKHCQQELRRV